MNTTKICKNKKGKGCGLEKSLDDFYFCHGHYLGMCKDCYKKHKKEYRNENKEKIQKYQKEYDKKRGNEELRKNWKKEYRKVERESRKQKVLLIRGITENELHEIWI